MHPVINFFDSLWKTLVQRAGELNVWEIVLLVIFSLSVSFLFFIRFLHRNKWLLVDLGRHKWLIK